MDIASNLTEQELWGCASEVLRQHGNDAPRHIAERIGALVMAGDMDGVAVWRSIAAKVDQLQRLSEAVQ